jgi:hypothetical protein
MPDFVQLWVYLSTAPLFGLTATLVVYVVAAAVYDRVERAPWANPVLWSVIVLGAMLLATATPYPTYFAGAQFVHVLLGPGGGGAGLAALAAPPRAAPAQRRAARRGAGRRRRRRRQRGAARVAARPARRGGALARLEVGDRAGGDGHRRAHRRRARARRGVRGADRLVGALSAKYLFNGLGIASWAVRGFALGTASHGIGAARALQVHDDAGAYAGIALGLQVLLASLMIPLLFRWLA